MCFVYLKYVMHRACIQEFHESRPKSHANNAAAPSCRAAAAASRSSAWSTCVESVGSWGCVGRLGLGGVQFSVSQHERARAALELGS